MNCNQCSKPLYYDDQLGVWICDYCDTEYIDPVEYLNLAKKFNLIGA